MVSWWVFDEDEEMKKGSTGPAGEAIFGVFRCSGDHLLAGQWRFVEKRRDFLRFRG